MVASDMTKPRWVRWSGLQRLSTASGPPWWCRPTA